MFTLESKGTQLAVPSEIWAARAVALSLQHNANHTTVILVRFNDQTICNFYYNLVHVRRVCFNTIVHLLSLCVRKNTLH